MHNRSAEPRDYTRVIEAEPDKLDIKRHSPGILYFAHNVRYGNSATFRIWVALESLQYLDNHDPQRFDFVLNVRQLIELVGYIITR